MAFQLLCTQGFHRVNNAHRPKTIMSYNAHLVTFVQFCEYIGTQCDCVSPQVLLAFIEFLVLNGLSHGSVLNYLSSLKQSFKMYNKNVIAFEHEWVRLALKNVARTVTTPMKVKGVFIIQQIKDIIDKCDSIPDGIVFRALFLTALFGFLRLSNLVPCSLTTFDILKHLAWGDAFFSTTHVTLIIKWSKTLQNPNQYATVQLPVLDNSLFCPAKALTRMYSVLPAGKNSPMFVVPQAQSYITLTQSKVRKMLKNIVLSLGLSPQLYSFHTFRRSGASLAFSQSTPVQDIQQQGTWSSDAVWAYIIQDPSRQNQVTSTFRNLFAST